MCVLGSSLLFWSRERPQCITHLSPLAAFGLKEDLPDEEEVHEHSSKIRGLCLMKLSSETLQNLSYFWNKKTQIYSFFHFE